MLSTMPPEVAARFETDQAGNPLFIEDDKKRRYYRITVEIENIPREVYAATFELHETYYDPITTLTPDSEGRIRLTTTSFGDYTMKVRLRSKEGEIQIIDTLSRALERGRLGMSPDVRVDQALAEIRAH
jgi:hypothetical protein